MHVAHDIRHHLAQPRRVTDQRDRLQLAIHSLQRAGMFPIRRFECDGAERHFAFRVERVQIIGRVGYERGE